MNIAVLINTCNRKQMLCLLLGDFFNQDKRPPCIIVVDNGSEDGTSDIVRSRFPSVHLIERKVNNGYFEGLQIGISTAFDMGYDAVWSVDDDARLRKDAFEMLMNMIDSHNDLKNAVVWCANITPDNRFFTEPVWVKDQGEWKMYDEFRPEELQGEIYETTGGPNIGVYIPKPVIDKVGPPRADMVFNGWQEFIFRVQNGGFKLMRIFTSILYHKRHRFHEVRIGGRTRHVSRASPWHTYYEIRNRIYTDIIHKRRPVTRSLMNTAVDSVIKVYICDNKLSTIMHILRGVYDGLLGRMGMRVRIPRLKH